MSASTFAPSWAICPGSTINDLVNAGRTSLSSLHQGLGISQDEMENLLSGKHRIDAPLAGKLSSVLGGSPRFWLIRDAQYIEDATKTGASVSAEDMIESFPFKQMVEFGWINKVRTKTDKALALLDFFRASTIADLESRLATYSSRYAFRTSSAFTADDFATFAWLREAERVSCGMEGVPLSLTLLKAAVPTLRQLSRRKVPSELLVELNTLLNPAGVRVVGVRPLKGCRASGATTILKDGGAIVALSFRFMTDDHLWFTLCHELAHLLLHSNSHLASCGTDEPKTVAEQEADDLARELLLPGFATSISFISRFDQSSVLKLARKFGVPPGIVVGRLQYDQLIRPDRLNYLKRRYRWGGSNYVPELA